MKEHQETSQRLPDSPARIGATGGIDAQRPTSRLHRAKLIVRGIEVRLRFVVIFAGIGLLMVYWTTLENYWDRWTRTSTAAATQADTEFYCPMHPSVVRPGLEPNGEVPKCPTCGMPLSERRKGELPELAEGVVGRVQLSPERVQLAGVKTVSAKYLPLERKIRTVGYVEYDQSRLSNIVSRVDGYLEALYVDRTFVEVARGERLAEVYSPALYSTAQEILLARRHGADDLIASGRQRMRLLGVSDEEIDELLAAGSARPRIVLRSPQAGYIVEKNVVEGSSVQAGMILFRVADLEKVWIEADVYERDLSFLRPGQGIEAEVEAYPGRRFEGEISLIYPQLNSTTRTARVRLTLDNPHGALKPGMFATVQIKRRVSDIEPFQRRLAARRNKPATDDIEALIAFQEICPVTGMRLGSMGTPVKVDVRGESIFLCCSGCRELFKEHADEYLARLAPPPEGTVLAIPENAVIDDGNKRIVYVQRTPGVFEGVEVELGPRVGDHYPVLGGLNTGDHVAAAGAFLIDAETRLNPAAAASYFGAGAAPDHHDEVSRDGAMRRKPAVEAARVEFSAEELANIAKLPSEEQMLAHQQRLCPISDTRLGSMGVPVRIVIRGEPVLLCCIGCQQEAEEKVDEVLEKLRQLKGVSRPQDPRLSPGEQGDTDD